VLRAWRRGELQLIVSPALLLELRDVLLRSKFRPDVSEARVRVRRFVAGVATHAALRPNPPVPVGATPDPDNDYLVGLARAAEANAIGLRRSRPAGRRGPPAAGDFPARALRSAAVPLKARGQHVLNKYHILRLARRHGVTPRDAFEYETVGQRPNPVHQATRHITARQVGLWLKARWASALGGSSPPPTPTLSCGTVLPAPVGNSVRRRLCGAMPTSCQRGHHRLFAELRRAPSGPLRPPSALPPPSY
jgi:PIN domain